MRKFLAALLMLVMLTPSLVCAMPVCLDKPKEAVTAETPCMEHAKDSQQSNTSKKTHVDFMQDCAGVDFQTASAPSIEKLDVVKFAFDVTASLPTNHQWMNAAYGLRGPPPRFSNALEAYPPVFLTTQRIRI
jgi:hypothetical protein